MFILILLLMGGFHLVISPFGGKHWLDGCLGTESREAVSAMVNGLCECWEVMSTDGLGIDRKQSVCMPFIYIATDKNQGKRLVLQSLGSHD